MTHQLNLNYTSSSIRPALWSPLALTGNPANFDRHQKKDRPTYVVVCIVFSFSPSERLGHIIQSRRTDPVRQSGRVARSLIVSYIGKQTLGTCSRHNSTSVEKCGSSIAIARLIQARLTVWLVRLRHVQFVHHRHHHEPDVTDATDQGTITPPPSLRPTTPL